MQAIFDEQCSDPRAHGRAPGRIDLPVRTVAGVEPSLDYARCSGASCADGRCVPPAVAEPFCAAQSGRMHRHHLIRLFAVVLFLGLTACAAEPRPATVTPIKVTTVDGVPFTTLTAGALTLTIALPDREHGYYRGFRFDGAGMVTQATWNKHTFFSELKQPHQPTDHDGVAGPAEEFGMDEPLGYAAAKPGEGFLKIGVGMLVKPDANAYSFHGDYALREAASWTSAASAGGLDFSTTQKLGDFAYRYDERIALLPRGDGFALIHTLANTGTAAFRTDHYSHNMIAIDARPIDSSYAVVYPFTPTVREGAAHFTAKNMMLTMGDDIANGTTQWAILAGHRTAPDAHAAADNQMTVANTAAHAAVVITTDQPIAKAVLYGERTALCPENFIVLSLAPGQSAEWTTMFQFRAWP